MVSERAAGTTPFEAMEVLDRANQLDDVIHLEVGEPDFEPPEAAVEAAITSLRAGGTGYTSSQGKPALREAITAYYDRTYGVDVPPDRIIVTPGSSPALMLAYLALLDAGDEAVLTDPHYACYPNFVRQAGGNVTTVPLDPADGFALDPARITQAITPDARAVMVNSPANPTGTVLPESILEDLVRDTERAGARVVSDEAYHGLSYDEPAHTVLEFTDDAFVVDSFSKRFAMTGWRLGWIVTPPTATDVVNRLAQNLLICAPDFVQDAGTAALTHADDFVPRMRDTYRERRDYLLGALDRLDLSLGYTPGGAYYVLADVTPHGDAFDVADALLDAGVATTPGRDFGEVPAPYLRLSYATTLDNLRTAVDRLRTAPVLADTTPDTHAE